VAGISALVFTVGILLVGVVVAGMHLYEGIPLATTVFDSSKLPIILLIIAVPTVFNVVLFAAVDVVSRFVRKMRWRVVVEDREHIDVAAMVVVLIALFVLLAIVSGSWGELPIQVGALVCVFGTLAWPLFAMGQYRRQQDRILDKIRATYVTAISALVAGDEGIGVPSVSWRMMREA
jgi:hypothetical protein